MDPIRPLMNASVAKSFAVLGFGARSPIYGLPPGFAVRLGTQPSHFFFSGIYMSNGVRIGFLRIPSMAPPNTALALQQLDQEIAFFNANTDVLIVDIMRNPAGTVSVVQAFAQRLLPQPFRSVGFEIRATAKWVTAIVLALSNAQAAGAPAEIIENLCAIMNEIVEAYNEDRGRTAPVPLGGTSLTLAPAPNAYTKPLLLLVEQTHTAECDGQPRIAASARHLCQTVVSSGRRILELLGRHVCRDPAGQSAGAAAWDADDGCRRQRRRIQLHRIYANTTAAHLDNVLTMFEVRGIDGGLMDGAAAN